MANVADYVIIADAWEWDDGNNTIKFTVPNNINTGKRCVLTFMIKAKSVEAMTLTVSINGDDVWTYSQGGGEGDARCMQEVIAANIVRAGENLFQFRTASDDFRASRLSDVVLWFQGTT